MLSKCNWCSAYRNEVFCRDTSKKLGSGIASRFFKNLRDLSRDFVKEHFSAPS